MKRILIVAGTLLLGAGAVMAQQEVAVQQDNLMRSIAKNQYGIILKMTKGEIPYDQKAVDQVTIMNAHNEAVTLWIDSLTHLPVKKSFTWRDPADKQRNVEEEVWDNYRLVQGMMTPFSITRYYNGDMSNQRFLTAVTFNKGLDDSLFDPQNRPSVPRK